MGKASSSKKVARAASTGGGRTNRGRTPVLYYGVLFVIAALGITGIMVSRGQGTANANVAPVVNKDHWHAAFGFYFCDRFVAAPTDKAPDTLGIHTHGDGLIHIHPFSPTTAGKNATLGAIITEIGGTLTQKKLGLPSHKTMTNGQKCGSTPGQVRVVVWDSGSARKSKPVAGDPKSLRLKQGQVITIAFAAPGKALPKPPSTARVTNPGDTGTTPAPAPVPTPTTVEGNTSSTTAPAAGSTTTTALK